MTGRAANVVLRVLQVTAAGVFLMAGFPKLAGAPEMVVLFDAVGARAASKCGNGRRVVDDGRPLAGNISAG